MNKILNAEIPSGTMKMDKLEGTFEDSLKEYNTNALQSNHSKNFKEYFHQY